METNSPKGLLVLCGTAIADGGEIPAQSLEVLRTSDLAIFESDRQARRFLKAAGVHRDYAILSEHDEKLTLSDAEAALRGGQSVSYMSDQGMPIVADPGQRLLVLAQRCHARIKVIPGPSAVTCALAACPFQMDRYLFAGFLPQEASGRKRELEIIARLGVAAVLMDTPYRYGALLGAIAEVMPKRKVYVAFDIGGPNERYLVDSASALLAKHGDGAEKENFVLVISAGAS